MACRGASLSLSRIQHALGEEAFRTLMSGGDNALLCALKSIPTYSMEADEMPNPAQVRPHACTVRFAGGALSSIDPARAS